MQLTDFKYRPNPLETGSIEKSDSRCNCFGTITVYINTSPVFAEEELDDYICPLCIANKEAHNKFYAEFSDIDGFEDYRIIMEGPWFICHSAAGSFSWLRDRDLSPSIAALLPETSRHQGDLV